MAVGDKSDLEIVVSFSDCSYSNLAIVKFGLFFLDTSIAEFKFSGITKLIVEFFSNKLVLDKGPIIFS